MSCCIVAVLLVAQILEFWRRVKRFCGFSVELYPDPYAEQHSLSLRGRLNVLLRRRAVRVGLALLVIAEGSMVAGWMVVEHGEHLHGLIGDVQSVFVDRSSSTDICSVREATAASTGFASER